MPDLADNDAIEPSYRVPTTLVLSLGAVGTALIAMFGEKGSFSALTAAAALAGLVPWALVAGGVRVPPALFAAMSLACAAIIVVVDLNPGGMFPVMLMVVWIARSSGDWRLNVVVLAASFGLILAAAIREGSAHETGLVYFAGGVGISWLAGRMLRRQEALTVELQAMNELRVEHAAAAERARIARDVHDVVAHSLTVVMLHLTGARRAISTDPVRADEALARAETVGRESLDSIRQVMGFLREPASGLAVPLPGLADVPALIDGYRTGGLAVDAVVDEVPGLDATVGLVAYRVVQESLANVLQHAPGAAASVEVTSVPASGQLHVTIVNGRPRREAAAPRVVRSGLGVRGMAERVRATGGELHAGPTDGGGWRVAATIPVRLGPAAATAGDRDDETAWTPQPTAG